METSDCNLSEGKMPAFVINFQVSYSLTKRLALWLSYLQSNNSICAYVSPFHIGKLLEATGDPFLTTEYEMRY